MTTVDTYRSIIAANVAANVRRLESGRGHRQYDRRMRHLRSRTSRLHEIIAALEAPTAA